MTDVVSAGFGALAARSPLAFPLVFAAGLVTSLGPCAAPRYVAVTALANGSRSGRRTVALFVAGLVAAYVCLGSAAGALAVVRGWSTYVYAALATALAIGGVVTLFAREHADEQHAVPRAAASGGGAFLLGASSALVVSPCCTPVLAGIAGLTVASGRAAEGIVLLASFAIGHAVPLVGAAFAGRRVAAILRRAAASPAPAVVAGTLMLGLSAYFGLLA